MGYQLKRMQFVLLYFVLMAVFVIADAATTFYGITKNLGVEINPLVNTSSFMSILLSPIPLILIIYSFATVAYCESNPARTKKLICKSQLILFLFTFPYFALVLKMLMTVNNLMLIFGLTPLVSWFVDLAQGSNLWGGIIFAGVSAAVFLPIVEKCLKSRYLSR